MIYHKDAANSKRRSVKIDDIHSSPVPGKEQRIMFATRLNKIILTQVMRSENILKDMKLVSLLHF